MAKRGEGPGGADASARADGLSESVGPALQAIRRRKGLTQKDVAERAGVTPAMLSAYERSRRRPSLVTLTRVLRALDVTLGDLDRAAEKVAEDGRPREEGRDAERGGDAPDSVFPQER